VRDSRNRTGVAGDGYRAVQPAGISCDGRAPFCILLYVMFFLNVVVVASTLFAAQPPTADAFEREAREIETMLMAPCCWSQPVSQHQSQASEEVKQQIRALLASGKNRQEVLNAFVAQYGQRILVEPPARGFGAVLYGGLLITFLLTASGLVLWVRRASRRPAAVTASMSAGGASDDAVYAARLDDELRDMD
jgi:cytochrome c-type biogenesis protein CcmH